MNPLDLLLAWVIALGTGLLLLATPSLSRASTFFAVTVPAEFPASEIGRGIRRRYLFATAAATLLALALVTPIGLLLNSITASIIVYFIAALVPVVGGLIAFVHCRGIALQYRRDESGTREVTLERDRLRDIVPGPLWLHIVPYLALAAAAAWLAWHWQAIPEAVVTTSGAEYQTRSILAVFGLPLIMVVTVALCHSMMPLGLLIRRLPGHRQRMRSINLFLLGVLWSISLTGAYDSLAVLYGERWVLGPIGITVNLVGTAIILLLPIWLLATGRFARSGEPQQGDRSPDDCWKLGLIYYNPDDPALWLEKRFGVGYTLNFARPTAWLLVVITLSLTAALLIWAFSVSAR